MTPAPARGRGMGTRLALSLSTLLVLCLLLEIGLRVAGVSVPSWTRPDPVLGWSYVPGAVYRFAAAEPCPGWGSSGRINAHGLRDRDIDYARAPGTFRILALGDSYTEGFQLPLEQTWTKRLEALLNARRDGRSYEVVNAGRSGMGTTAECLFYEHEGRRYHPDLVLLLFIPNDVADNSRALALPMAYGPYFRLEGSALALDESFRESRGYHVRTLLTPAKRASVLVSLTLRAGNELAAPRAQRASSSAGDGGVAAGDDAGAAACALAPADEANLWLPDPPRPWRDALTLTQAVLRRLDAAVRSDGARFVLVEGTTRMQVQPRAMERARRQHPSLDLDRVHGYLGSVALGEGALDLDLVPIFRARAARGDIALHGCAQNDEDGHWSRDGHALAATAIADFLTSSGALEP
jgi:hypothetical protein